MSTLSLRRSLSSAYGFHKTLGALLILPLLFFSITGIFIGFRESYQNARLRSHFLELKDSHPGELDRPERPLPADKHNFKAPHPFPIHQMWNQLWKSLENRSSESEKSLNYDLARIEFPSSISDPVRFRIRVSPTSELSSQLPEKDLIAYFHPETAELLSVEEEEENLMDWMVQLHHEALAGTVGKAFASTLAFLILLLWPSGILLHQKARQKFRKLRTQREGGGSTFPWPSSTQFYSRLHRLLGYSGGLLISWMALSGSLMNFKKELLRSFDPEPRSIHPEFRLNLEMPLLDFLTQTAEKLKSGIPLQSIRFQKHPDQTLLFYFQDTSRIYLDPATQQVTKITTPFSHWIQTLFPFHSGRGFGVMRLPYVLGTGGLCLILATTGWILILRPQSWKPRAVLYNFARLFQRPSERDILPDKF